MPSREPPDHFNQLIKKYLTGKATPDEVSFVEQYYQSFERNDDLTDFLGGSEIEEIQERIAGRLNREISGRNNGSGNATGNRWIGRMVAAAAVLLAVVGGALYFKLAPVSGTADDSLVTGSITQQDVLPGGNRAVLILEDGSKLFLDSSANGTISQQGNIQVVKLSNGEVVYKQKDNYSSEVFINTMITPRGGQFQLILADGTKVWMNAASSITYPTAFTGKERRVKVKGEVFFEVATMVKNGEKEKLPFIVETDPVSGQNGMEIRVLGTQFNVNTYADNGTGVTTLLEGSVLIKSGKEKKVLEPGQQAEVGDVIKINHGVDTDMVTAWKNGHFSFNNTSLVMVMKQLERWYDVEVVYEQKQPEMKFWGGISMNSNLSQVLKILEASQVSLRIEGKKIIVLSK